MNPSFLQRYLGGEREQVWTDLVALGERVRSEAHYEDAWAVALETMRRVRHNLEILQQRLPESPYTMDLSISWRQPDAQYIQDVHRFESEVGTLPLSLRAFGEVVGSFSMGSQKRHPLASFDPMDLECPNLSEDVLSQLKTCYGPQLGMDEYHDIGADFATKEGCSGDCYYVKLPDANADFLIDPMGEYFVDYLRNSLRNGAFRGAPFFEDDPNLVLWSPPPAEKIAHLTIGFLPI